MVKLEKFEKLDFNRLISWIDTAEAMIQFSGSIFNFPLTHEQLDKYILCESRMIYKILDSVTGIIIGHAELNNIDRENKTARVCRVLVGDKMNRNNGYGKAIIKELIRIGFNELYLHRLELGVFNFNQQAIKCYKNCGFEIEGLLRENYRVRDEYWSTYTMSIINNNN